MGETKIAWTEKTWNPVVGCTRMSAGCDNCYALAMARRQVGMGTKAYRGLVDAKGWAGVRCLPERLEEPLHWRKPKMVFVCSMGDLFHKDVPVEFIGRVLRTTRACPQHTFQILSKRDKRLVWSILTLAWPPNAWFGVTVENDKAYDRAHLLGGFVTAHTRFLSCEPLIGPLDNLPLDGISWVICGGETGPGARLCKVEWIRSIIKQCRAAGVAVFVKQLGARNDYSGRWVLTGTNADPNRWPVDLRGVRQYPAAVRVGA